MLLYSIKLKEKNGTQSLTYISESNLFADSHLKNFGVVSILVV